MYITENILGRLVSITLLYSKSDRIQVVLQVDGGFVLNR